MEYINCLKLTNPSEDPKSITRFWLGRTNPFCAYINSKRNYESPIVIDWETRLALFDARWKESIY